MHDDDAYAIDTGEKDRRRLDLLARSLEATTLELLSEAGVRIGHRCLDLGCGGGDVARTIARIVTETGHVVGVDRNPEILELARFEARDAGLRNIRYHCADAHAFAGDGFDFVYSRFLASHLKDPAAFLSKMLSCAKIGGKIVVEDIDVAGCFTDPADPGHLRFVAWYREAVRRMGGDGELGRRLPLMATGAGWSDVKWNIVQPAYTGGEAKHLPARTVENIRATVVSHGIAAEDEVDAVIRDMHAFAASSETLVALPRFVQVWGTRSA